MSEKNAIKSVLLGAALRPKSFTSGNFPLFDNDGNLSDSGKRPDSFAHALVTTDGPSPVLRIYPDAGSTLRPVSHIVAVQEGEGDPSPENVRPITGLESAILTVAGKNMFGGLALANKIKAMNQNAVINTDQKTVTYEGRDVDSKVIFDAFSPNTQYTLILYGKNTNSVIKSANLVIKYTDGTSSDLSFETAGEESYCVITSSAEKSVASIEGDWISYGTTLYYEKCGLFEGTVGIDGFLEYAGQTVALPFGQTVYGGTLDWASGVLTVTHAMDIVDGTQTMSFATMTQGSYFTARLSNYSLRQATIQCSNIRPERNYVSATRPFAYIASSSYNNLYIWPSDGMGISDLESAKAWLVSNPVTVVYPLAEPQTIQLTTTQISALAGLNTVYSDTGDTSATYNKSITKAIEELQTAILNLTGGTAQ